MLIQLLLQFLFFLINLVLQLLPNIQIIPSQAETAFTWLFSRFDGLNTLLPVTEILQCVSIVLLFEFGYLGYRVIIWILNMVRGNNAKI